MKEKQKKNILKEKQSQKQSLRYCLPMSNINYVLPPQTQKETQAQTHSLRYRQ